MILFMGMGKIKTGKEKEFEDALQAYYPHLLEEEGTVEYVVYRGTKDPNQVAFYEVYKDKSARKAHGDSPYAKEFVRILRECREEDVMMGVFEEIAAKK